MFIRIVYQGWEELKQEWDFRELQHLEEDKNEQDNNNNDKSNSGKWLLVVWDV